MAKASPGHWGQLRRRVLDKLDAATAKNKGHCRRFYSPERLTRIGEVVRNPFERDYARIIQSSSFRRLQAKMQLLGIRTSDFYRTRLTHSIEVAQVARALALYLGADQILVEAAALCHDIGNPPFGHAGEDELNQLMSGHGGFDGNAQGLRTVCLLERKLLNYPGLNLTAATRLALVKYNVFNSPESKKFLYMTERRFIRDAEAQSDLHPQTLECQIMELADDIAYAAHDLEDGLKASHISIDDLANNEDLKDLRGIFEKIEIEQYGGRRASKVRGGVEDMRKVKRKELSSRLINRFVNSVDLKEADSKETRPRGSRQAYHLTLGKSAKLVKALKDFTFKMIVRHSSVALMEAHGRRVIRELFEILSDRGFNNRNRLLPLEFQDRLGEPETYFEGLDPEQARLRCISDYIAGMTDSYADTRHQELLKGCQGR
jgi:dGTPase